MCPFLKAKKVNKPNNFAKNNSNFVPTNPLPESSMSPRPLPLPSQRHRVFSSSSLNLDAIFFWWGLKVKRKNQVLPLGLGSIHRFHFLNFTEKINYFWEGSKPENNTVASKRRAQITERKESVSNVCFCILGRTKPQETFVYVRSLVRRWWREMVKSLEYIISKWNLINCC